MDYTEIKNRIERKIKYFVNNIWDGLNETDISRFLGNFSKEDEIVGYVLLDMLIFYSSEQEQSIVENLIRLFKKDLWISNVEDFCKKTSSQINHELNILLNNTCMVPVIDSDMSDSALGISPFFKKTKLFPSSMKYINPDELVIYVAMRKRIIVFYDDMIGSGQQFVDFIQKKRFKDFSIKDIVNRNEDIYFYYLAFSGFKEGIEYINQEVPQIRVIVSEFFDEENMITNVSNDYWYYNFELKEKVIDYIQRKKELYRTKNNFSKDLAVMFQHTRASNTCLSLYWIKRTGEWEALYER